MHSVGLRWLAWVLAGAFVVASFAGCETGAPARSRPNLSASVQGLDPASGAVTINGVDLRRPEKPFLFDWGDGKTSESFFPASHVYADPRRNYIVKVSARQSDGTADTVTVPVFFRELRQDLPTAPVRSRY